MKKPVIAISCNFDSSYNIFKSGDISDITVMYHYVSDNYTRAVEEAGGIPMLLPIYKDEADLRAALELADGVLLSGGNDIDPLIFGELDRGKTGHIVPKRDAQDLFIARYIYNETNKPLLGICRGVQVMNVALGGTIYQDLEADGGFLQHSKGNYPMNAVSHHIAIDERSILRELLGSAKAGVNSYHHQAVKDVAPGFFASALSDDGVIEAIEPVKTDNDAAEASLSSSGRKGTASYSEQSEECFAGNAASLSQGSASGLNRFVLGVQWHPEKMYDSEVQNRIFKEFIRACS